MNTVATAEKHIKTKHKRLTHEEFVQEVNRIHKGITIVGIYQGSGKPISYQCQRCTRIHHIKQAADLIGKKGENRKYTCRECFWEDRHQNHREKGRQRALEKLKKFPNIQYVSEYRDEKENRLFFVLHCRTCQHTWDINATSNMKAHWKGCPSCWMKSEALQKAREKGLKQSIAKKKREAKKSFFFLLHGNTKIRVLDDYQDTKTSIRFQCMDCEHIWGTAPGHIVNSKSGCPKCNSGFTKAKNEYEEQVEQIHRGMVRVLQEYQGANVKIKHQCTECDGIWSVMPSSIKQGSGCPYCNNSKGEKRIFHFLQLEGIPFEKEWKNHTCRMKNILPFDYYLPTYNIAIEFQGVQHERFSPPFHRTKQDLYAQQRRDAVKKQYCKENNIHFIEIWYYEMDQIEEILHKRLREVEKNIVHK